MPEPETVRAFLAVPADPRWSAAAERLSASLQPVSPPASWTRPEAWHLTLKFLGNAPAFVLEEFGRAIGAAAARIRGGDLLCSGAAVFPPHGPPRVLGLGFAPSPGFGAVRDLATAAEGEARRLGLEREDRPYHPHVTLARLKTRWPPQALDRFRNAAAGASSRFPVWTVRSCVLYASRLDPAGAVHTPLGEWKLRLG
jgi:RNA 2',3'-cyclic 3'-phosphodiesterase